MATEGKGETTTTEISTTIPVHRQVRNEFRDNMKICFLFCLGIIKMARLGLS